MNPLLVELQNFWLFLKAILEVGVFTGLAFSVIFIAACEWYRHGGHRG